MRRLKAQQQFAAMVPELIKWARLLGYRVTLGDAYRDKRCAYGSPRTAHRKRLAIDLNLFDRQDHYIKDSEGHDMLGVKWENIGGIWGGRFSNHDYNHYQWPEGGVEDEPKVREV